MVRNLGTNAKRGAGELLVVEADEYDRTFHQLHPEIAVVTNIEADHLEYYETFEDILEAFRIFVGGIKRGRRGDRLRRRSKTSRVCSRHAEARAVSATARPRARTCAR